MIQLFSLNVKSFIVSVLYYAPLYWKFTIISAKKIKKRRPSRQANKDKMKFYKDNNCGVSFGVKNSNLLYFQGEYQSPNSLLIKGSRVRIPGRPPKGRILRLFCCPGIQSAKSRGRMPSGINPGQSRSKFCCKRNGIIFAQWQNLATRSMLFRAIINMAQVC